MIPFLIGMAIRTGLSKILIDMVPNVAVRYILTSALAHKLLSELGVKGADTKLLPGFEPAALNDPVVQAIRGLETIFSDLDRSRVSTSTLEQFKGTADLLGGGSKFPITEELLSDFKSSIDKIREMVLGGMTNAAISGNEDFRHLLLIETYAAAIQNVKPSFRTPLRIITVEHLRKRGQ